MTYDFTSLRPEKKTKKRQTAKNEFWKWNSKFNLDFSRPHLIFDPVSMVTLLYPNRYHANLIMWVSPSTFKVTRRGKEILGNSQVWSTSHIIVVRGQKKNTNVKTTSLTDGSSRRFWLRRQTSNKPLFFPSMNEPRYIREDLMQCFCSF